MRQARAGRRAAFRARPLLLPPSSARRSRLLHNLDLARMDQLDPRAAPFLDRAPDPNPPACQLPERQTCGLECALVALQSRDGEVLRPAPPEIDIDKAAALADRQ